MLDTCDVKVMLPGITDTATLRMASDLCGQAALKERGEDWITRQDVMTPDMIRQLPAGFALIVRGGCAPVVARLGAAWRDPAYKNARQRGELVAALTAPADLAVPGQVPDWFGPDGIPDVEAADELGDFDPDGDFPWS